MILYLKTAAEVSKHYAKEVADAEYSLFRAERLRTVDKFRGMSMRHLASGKRKDGLVPVVQIVGRLPDMGYLDADGNFILHSELDSYRPTPEEIDRLKEPFRKRYEAMGRDASSPPPPTNEQRLAELQERMTSRIPDGMALPYDDTNTWEDRKIYYAD